MSRRVWPHAFFLFTCELTDAFKLGLAAEVERKIFEGANPQGFAAPVALRWATDPRLGFPRQPFQVFRRPRFDTRNVLLASTVPVDGTVTVIWALGQMYEVTFNASPDPGFTLRIDAISSYGQPIPGQRITVGSASIGRFRVPGIASLRVSGRGSVDSIRGLNQDEMANAPEWVRIEVVGLPFKEGEVAPPFYNPQPQGFETPTLSGFDAARRRLDIARGLQLPIPPTGVPDIPTPPWFPPAPDLFLQRLRDPVSPMQLIRECLADSNDADPSRMQVEFISRQTLDAMKQIDMPGPNPPGDPTETEIPVVAVTILAVSNESFGATGLGYGTVDFPRLAALPVGIQPGSLEQVGNKPVVDPPGITSALFDYMVTAEFVLPFGIKIELAALAQVRPLPERASSLSIFSLRPNRAPARDFPATEAVQLKWRLSSLQQGYGVIVSRTPGQGQVLNAPRIAGGFDPFIPLRPPSVDGDVPAGALTVFTDPVSPLPFSGVQPSRYMVIGLDVFGRWSAWRGGDYAGAALPVTKPGLHSATLIMNASTAVGHVVPASLEIEFSWDWTDRSPDRVVFTGRFFNAGGPPGPSFIAGFRSTETGPIGPAVVVKFDGSGNPSILAGSATVEQLTSTPPDPERPKYRLTVAGLSCDFTSRSRVAFEVYARGAERVRPAELSDVVGARVALADDPIPPTIPPLPVDLRWTALPDATGRGRGLLTWPASASAAGYIIWEATEAALRAAVNPGLPDPLPGTSLLSRAADLRSLVIASPQSQDKSMQAFSRLNTRPIEQARAELELPASADSLYAYRISAINRSNVESARSSEIVMFAVPKRNQPGQPHLLLRQVSAPTPGILVIAIPGAGVSPVGYRIHKVRRANLAADVGLMGPPKIEHDSPGWLSLSAVLSDPASTKLHSLIQSLDDFERLHGMALLDAIAPSWFPYFYRIVAVGEENLAAGEFRGESIASVSQQAFLTPADPPLIEFVALNGNKKNSVLRFRTDLPISLSPLSPARIAVFQLVKDDLTNRMVRVSVLSVQTENVAQGPRLRVIDAPTPEELNAMPEINRRGLDAQGRATYSTRMLGRIRQGIVVVTDPLGRSTELHFPN